MAGPPRRLETRALWEGQPSLTFAFGCGMRAKRALLLLFTLAVMAGAAVLVVRPRQYFRYQAGRTYVVNDPSACFNGLRSGPCLQFEIPVLTRASSWRPSVAQVRRAIAESKVSLSDEETTQIIRECTASSQGTKPPEPGGAANRSRPIGSDPNRTPSPAGSGG
jgi:hypothetical protein